MGGAHPSTFSGAVAAINSASAAAAAAALVQLSMLLSEVEMADACVPEDFPERPVSSGIAGAGIAAGEIRFKTTWQARARCRRSTREKPGKPGWRILPQVHLKITRRSIGEGVEKA